MKATNKEMKTEALKRINSLKLDENIYTQFLDDETLNVSYYGALYHPTDKQLNRIREFESDSGNLVYHVIQNFTEFGELLTFLYVSKHKNDWGFDRADLENGTPMAYVANVTDEVCSEYGSIEIKSYMGGLLRTD